MSTFLSHLLSDLRSARLTRRGATHHAEDVPRFQHKDYSRMQTITLPKPVFLQMSLSDALKKRTSAFEGDAETPLSLAECGTLLGHALGKREQADNRNYPSGGALYPIETYLISTAIEGQDPGVFHYNPSKHALERLWNLPPETEMKDLARHPESLPLSTLIIFTSVWKRSSAKYGDLSFLHALLEAGHMSENILLVGTAVSLNVRPYAGFTDERITALLDLDEKEEQAVHCVTLCKPKKKSETSPN